MALDKKIQKIVENLKNCAIDEARKELKEKIIKYNDLIEEFEIDADSLAEFLIPAEVELKEKTRTKAKGDVVNPCEATIKSGDKKGQQCGHKGNEEYEGKWYCGRHIKGAKSGTTSTKTGSKKKVEKESKLDKNIKASKAIPLTVPDDSDDDEDIF